jgi:hypothetical protein
MPSKLALVNEALATSITVTSTTNMTALDPIGIRLDNGTVHWTTIQTVTDATHLALTAAIPSGRSAPSGGAVYTMHWRSLNVIY